VTPARRTAHEQAASFVLVVGDVSVALAQLVAEAATWSRLIRERGLRFEG
jgi:hypothetical protein